MGLPGRLLGKREQENNRQVPRLICITQIKREKDCRLLARKGGEGDAIQLHFAPAWLSKHIIAINALISTLDRPNSSG